MQRQMNFKNVISLVAAMFFFMSLSFSQTNWLDHAFSSNNGWDVNKHIRTTGDVNGDGNDDLVGFGQYDVYVAFSNGKGFNKPSQLQKDLTISQGWDVKKNPRMMGDVNGDGRDDIIAYGNDGVYVSLSNGGYFLPAKMFLKHYYTAANGWNPSQHVRTCGDINGDGKTDLVGFGGKGVFVAFSNGSGFSTPEMLVENFAIGSGGWSVDHHTRLVADVNGDGKDDIIGYGGPGVFVSISTGRGLSAARLYLKHSFTAANGWQNSMHVRTAGDINGDGKADLVGFGQKGVYVAMSLGNKFREPILLVNNYSYDLGMWRVDKHVRVMADVNGDGRSDIVGYGTGAVLVEPNMKGLKVDYANKRNGRN